jgi:hypothetical protein
MPRHVCLLIGAILLTASPAAAVSRTDPAQRLAREIEGRVAGEPIRCLDRRDVRVRSKRIIDGTAIIYDAGGTLYVNRPSAGSEFLDRNDFAIVWPSDRKVCSMDRLYMSRSPGEAVSGTVVLGDFVPYSKPK